MCELFGMSSNREATISLSLMQLAEHGGLSAPHRDGWGIAYYEGTDVRLIKDAGAAADSDWISFIRDHNLRQTLRGSRSIRAPLSQGRWQPFEEIEVIALSNARLVARVVAE